MLYPFFEQAARSVSRQQTYRRLLSLRLGLVALTILIVGLSPRRDLFVTLGFVLTVTGIVEGALLLGWRLTQLPKSRSLEPILLSPVSPRLVMLNEQLVGLTLLAFVTLSSVPILVGLWAAGWIDPIEAALLPVFGFTWGAVTGLGLTWWAYEPLSVRRWGERITLGLLLVYLVVGGLAGEHTFRWLSKLPWDMGLRIRDFFLLINEDNPFALIHRIAVGREEGLLQRVILIESLALGAAFCFLVRASFRLHAHYLERNYSPAATALGKNRPQVGDRPLQWWAVKRVNEYPGRINLWLAGGAAVMYSIFLVMGNRWPVWLGANTFVVFELMGGVAGLSTGLVLLAAVPAAYQYGLWDSSIPERCRRLELLLLTHLNATDYLVASWSAAWNRGRGYFLAACLLLAAGCYAGRYNSAHLAMALMAAIALIGLCFAVAFRNFASSRAGGSLGFLMTVVMPLLTWVLGSNGLQWVARSLPPGMVFYAVRGTAPLMQFVVSLFVWLALAAVLLHRGRSAFDAELRAWYDANHGKR